MSAVAAFVAVVVEIIHTTFTVANGASLTSSSQKSFVAAFVSVMVVGQSTTLESTLLFLWSQIPIVTAFERHIVIWF